MADIDGTPPATEPPPPPGGLMCLFRQTEETAQMGRQIDRDTRHTNRPDRKRARVTIITAELRARSGRR